MSWSFRCAGAAAKRGGWSPSADAVYGAYLDQEQALLDAVDAARDALQGGREAQVWVRDRTTAARVF